MALEFKREGKKSWFLGIWKEQFRMGYLYCLPGHRTLAFGLLNRRPHISIIKRHPSM